mmetsp:Transcript_13856/g.43781  ORF Transcript_13856/g.43781 Transcript_13856/m.43781 type:complete len:368 (+) Transcript_13856:68-1171(+)
MSAMTWSPEAVEPAQLQKALRAEWCSCLFFPLSCLARSWRSESRLPDVTPPEPVESPRSEEPEWTPFVVDVGSYQLRGGWARDEDPSVAFRCVTGRPKPTLGAAATARLLAERSDDGATVAGSQCEGVEALLDVSEPCGADAVTDWDGLAGLFRAATPDDATTLLIAAPLGAGRPDDAPFAKFAADALDHSFETLDRLDAVAVVSAAPLAMFAAGLVEGAALCVGYHRTVAALVTHGAAERCAALPVGGADRLPDDTALDALFGRPDPLHTALLPVLADRHPDEIAALATLHLSGGASFFEAYRPRLQAGLAHHPRLASLRCEHAPDAFAAWRGAAVVGHSPQFTSWITRDDFAEHGPARAASFFTL